MDAIQTAGLTKHYGRFTALRDLTLRIPTGSLFGFLGPNGAGKSTTLRLLLGLLRPSAGRSWVFERDCWRDGPALRAQVGYLAGDVRLWDWRSGAGTLGFLDAARGGRGQAEIRRLAARFDLDLSKRVRNYSRGMKQKLGLIAALFHRPRLLILDEPTSGLDPLMRDALFGELRAAVADGRTVLFSSHTLSEVEELCDEIAILRGGQLVEQERIDVLRRRAVRHVEIRLASGPAPPPPPGFTAAQAGAGPTLRGTWNGPPAPLLAWLNAAPVVDVTIAPPDLEDLFRTYYTAREVNA